MRYVWFSIIILLTIGCDREREERTVHIAVSLAGTDAYASTKHIQAITDAAEDGNIDVIWRIAQWDHELQNRQIDTLFAEMPDIIAVEITDPRRADEILGPIQQQEIPVVGFNRLAPSFQYDLIVSPDYYEIGNELAEAVVERYDSREINILLLYGSVFSGQDSLIIESFLSVIEEYDNFTVQKKETVQKELLQDSNAAIAIDPLLTRRLVQSITEMDEAGMEHRSPFIAGIGEKESFTMIDYDNLLLIDRQQYTAGTLLVNAASDYARGEFRHLEGPVIQVGEYMMPVVYTPYRVVHPD